MKYFFKYYENSVAATIRLLGLLNIKATNTTIREYILSHPDYPSLLCISDCLKSLKIANGAGKFSKEDIDTIPTPCIAYTTNGFTVINDFQAEKISFVNDEGILKEETNEDFFMKWGGVVLIAEPNSDSGEKGYEQKRKTENKKILIPSIATTAIVLLAVLSSYLFSTTVSGFPLILGNLILLFSKLSGIGITILLLWYELDKYNPLLQKICRGGGEKSNCNAILNSPAAKLFSFLSWGEVGFFYFSTGFIMLCIQPTIVSIHCLVWLNIFALPYILFSVFYQWRIAKQWCPLCLTVQALLAIEFITAVSTGLITPITDVIPGIDAKTISLYLFSFIIPSIMWYLVKPQLVSKINNQKKAYELARLKSNKEIFSSLLSGQKKIKETNEDLGIMLGNPEATNTLIKVCNPYCGPCAKAYPEMEELLTDYQNVKARVIFAVTLSKSDINSMAAKHLLAIADLKDKSVIKKAMRDWYTAETKDYPVFSKKYPMNNQLNEQEIKIKEMKIWCIQNGVEYTPTYFFNGFRLPEMYSISDLKFLLTE